MAGHGSINLNADGTVPTTVVPDGTSVTVPIGHNQSLLDDAGRLIEAGDVDGGMRLQQEILPDSIEGAQTYLPGAEIPDYVIHPGPDLNILPGSRTVDRQTPLSEILAPNMGWINLATCTNEFPNGTMFEE
ncbi:putative adhesin [Halovulum sp. GXIMD14793]